MTATAARSLECPAPPQWDSWLRGDLTADESTRLDDHARSCAACRSSIDSLTDDHSLRSWTTPLNGRSPRYPDFDLPASADSGLLGRLGPYDVVSEIAQGGMGIVFEARDTSLRRSVALKVLRAGRDDARFIERFLREARAAARIQHPNVLPIHGIEHTRDGRPVLVLPLVIGETLKQRIARERLIPPAEAAAILAAVTEGLQAAHQSGLIHRDVKPSNILLDKTDGRAKLADFGLVRDREHDGTTTDGTLGTLEYMSPEQLSSPSKVDARSDVYSLGATLYEALTGVPPFRGTAADIIARIANEDPLPTTDLVPSLPRDLNTICLTALAKDPARRYATAGAFRDDLERWRTGQPILARRQSTLDRTVKWIRRKPAAAAAVGLLVVLVIVLGAAAFWLQSALSRTRQAEALAQTRLDEVLTEQRQRERAEMLRNGVSDFFVKDLLLQADPSLQKAGQRDPQITVRALLDQAGERIAVSRDLDPELAINLRANLGKCYRSMGLFAEALPHFETALAASRSLHGDDHLATLQLRGHVASTIGSLNRPTESITLKEAVLNDLIRLFGPWHTETLFAKHNLAVTYAETGQFAKAVELHQSNLDYRRETLGPDALETLQTADALVVALANQGKPRDALTLSLDTVTRARRTLGDDHNTTLTAQSNLASIYDHLGERRNAIPIYESILPHFTAQYGPDHGQTLIVRNNLALDLTFVNETAKGLAMMESVLADATKKHGPEHSAAFIARNNIATVHVLGGEPMRAIPFLEENGRLITKLHSPRDPRAIIGYHNLANSYRKVGRREDALKTWDEKVIPYARATFGESDVRTLNVIRNRTRTLSELGLSEEERCERLALLDLERKAFPADDLRLADALDELGEMLIKQRDFGTAESFLKESLTIQSKTRNDSHWELLRTRIRMGIAAARQGRMDETMLTSALQALDSPGIQIPGSWRTTLQREVFTLFREHEESRGQAEKALFWKMKLEQLSEKPGK